MNYDFRVVRVLIPVVLLAEIILILKALRVKLVLKLLLHVDNRSTHQTAAISPADLVIALVMMASSTVYFIRGETEIHIYRALRSIDLEILALMILAAMSLGHFLISFSHRSRSTPIRVSLSLTLFTATIR